jgi:hypothetical protein
MTGEKNQMSNGKRSIGLFGVSGVLVAALIIAAFVAMGGIFQAQGKGTLTIQVTDAPADVSELWLAVDEIKIQGNEVFVPLELNLPDGEQSVSFDLLSLQGIYETLVQTTEIPEGDYSMIRIHVLTAGTTEGANDLTVPSNEIKVLLLPNLHVNAGEDVTVLIDLQIEDVHAITNSQTVNIRPVVKSVFQSVET